jgi:hypothetical protein
MCVLASVLMTMSDASGADVAVLKSFMPTRNIAAFVVDNFDLSTIRSSFGPRRPRGERAFFADFGMKPSELTETRAVFDYPFDWYYEIEVLAVADVNQDGFMDLAICFTDDSSQGTYLTVDPYLLTRFSYDMPLIALAYQPSDESCPRHPSNR